MPLGFIENTGLIRSIYHITPSYGATLFLWSRHSHTFVPQMPPYITGVTHWENLHKFLWHYNGPRQCCFKILAMLVFPILSVSVAYFSWPHLIGTEVFYIMAGIGYDHSFFKKFKLITEKAELSGNPRCAFFPESADTLMNVSALCFISCC